MDKTKGSCLLLTAYTWSVVQLTELINQEQRVQDAWRQLAEDYEDYDSAEKITARHRRRAYGASHTQYIYMYLLVCVDVHVRVHAFN